MANENRVGAAWKKNGAKGEYFSIQMELDGVKTNYVMFTNDYKGDNAKAPDFVILKSIKKPA